MTATLLTIACDVSVEALRCDLFDPATGTLYRGAAIHGAGGPVRCGSVGATEARRLLVMVLWLCMRRGAKATVYTRHRADSDAVVELDAGPLEVRAVYLPGETERSTAA